DDVALFLLEIAGDGHTEASRDRSGGVCRAKRIVFAFIALGEARKPALLAQRTDAVASTRQNLVRIGLMADVKDQAGVGRIENVMQGERQLYDAKTRTQMAARLRDGVDQLGPQLSRKLRQLRFIELLQVGRNFDPIKERGYRGIGHASHARFVSTP